MPNEEETAFLWFMQSFVEIWKSNHFCSTVVAYLNNQVTRVRNAIGKAV